MTYSREKDDITRRLEGLPPRDDDVGGAREFMFAVAFLGAGSAVALAVALICNRLPYRIWP